MGKTNIISESEFDLLIEQTKSGLQSPGERVRQRKGWVIGELMLAHPHLAQHTIEKIVDKAIRDLIRKENSGK